MRLVIWAENENEPLLRASYLLIGDLDHIPIAGKHFLDTCTDRSVSHMLVLLSFCHNFNRCLGLCVLAIFLRLLDVVLCDVCEHTLLQSLITVDLLAWNHFTDAAAHNTVVLVVMASMRVLLMFLSAVHCSQAEGIFLSHACEYHLGQVHHGFKGTHNREAAEVDHDLDVLLVDQVS